jgi:hypothetical protein
MNLQKLLFSFILFVVFCSEIYSQDDSWKKRLYTEVQYHYGFLMPHSEFIAFFVKDHIQGFQVNLGLSANGAKDWHHSYNYPRLGIGYHRSGLSNSYIYGQMDAVFGYVDRYYLNWNRKFNFGNKLSLGGAFVNKKFDLENNGTNMAIGSRLNAYVNYSIETIYKLFPGAELKLGAGITHVSNGNFSQPNKGLNFFTAFTAVTYNFNQQVIKTEPLQNESTARHQFMVLALYGRKQVSRKINNSYNVSGISGEYARLITGNSWGGVAMSLYHDPSLEKELSINDTITTRFSDRIRIALNLSYELKMGRLSYVFQPGVYLKNSYKISGNISNKLSVRYQLTPTLNAGMTIKAHWFAIADFFEWGIGYRWKK